MWRQLRWWPWAFLVCWLIGFGRRLARYRPDVEPSEFGTLAPVTLAPVPVVSALAACGLTTTGGIDRFPNRSGPPTSR